MEDLLPYYERELGIFRQYSRRFAQRYPKTAGQLLIAGEASEDPHIERLIQSFAFLTARVSKRLDSDYPQFTESLLESLYPHYLRPLPSYSIVQMSSPAHLDGESAVVLPRGVMLQSGSVDGVRCQFKTIYDVLLGPLAITSLEFRAFLEEPTLDGCLPAETTSALSLSIVVGDQMPDWRSKLPPRLRLFVNGELSLRGALLDALLIRTCKVFAKAEGAHQWSPLRCSPFSLAGLGDDDAMLPFSARSNPAFRLLTEYFSYPEKFNFVDLDLAAIRECLPPQCQKFTLLLAISDVPPDSNEARLLGSLRPDMLMTGCTPVINLFEKRGVPFQVTHTEADYGLLADSTHACAYDIHSINSVKLFRETADGKVSTEFAPLYTSQHDPFGEQSAGCYWLARRDEMVASVSPGHEVRLTLIDPDSKAGNGGLATVLTGLSCTNRDLPSQLPFGDPAGDLRSESVATTTVIRLLRKTTASYRFANGNGAHWKLINHLTLNYGALSSAGANGLQRMLLLYDLPKSASSQRQIRGIVAVEIGTARQWMPTLPVDSLMAGIAIRITLDERAFVGTGMAIFAHVMDRYFALNRQLNCFTQFEIISAQSGKEIMKCPPRSNEAL